MESHTPSITPSLLPYVENEEYDNENVVYGVATEVTVGSEPMQNQYNQRPLPAPPVPSSPSDYGTSPRASEPSKSPARRSFTDYVATTGESYARFCSPYDHENTRVINPDDLEDLLDLSEVSPHPLRKSPRRSISLDI